MNVDITAKSTAPVRCYAERRNVLGEGPCWDDRSGELYWVDIAAGNIEVVAGSGAVRQIRPRVAPTALSIRKETGLLVASAGEVGVLDAKDEYEKRVALAQEPNGNRTNDGNTGADGRFWFGTMDNAEVETTGSVYALTPEWTLTRRLTGLRIPNALVTSPDGKLIYIADSALGILRAHRIEDNGVLSSPVASVSTAHEDCAPDGAAVDEEGFVWNAQWDGWRLVRYSPDLQVDRIVPLPVARPTSCAFGGPDMRTLFVTSASIGLVPAELEAQPLAGSVLAVDAGVRGAPIMPFAG